MLTSGGSGAAPRSSAGGSVVVDGIDAVAEAGAGAAGGGTTSSDTDSRVSAGGVSCIGWPVAGVAIKAAVAIAKGERKDFIVCEPHSSVQCCG